MPDRDRVVPIPALVPSAARSACRPLLGKILRVVARKAWSERIVNVLNLRASRTRPALPIPVRSWVRTVRWADGAWVPRLGATRIVLSALALYLAGGANARAQPTVRKRTLPEVAALNGVTSTGDAGRLDTSTAVVSPLGRNGFSMRIDWLDHPRPPHYWSIRIPIGAEVPIARAQGLELDVYVEEASRDASLAVYLTESDGDRWVALSTPLAELPPKRWHHVSVGRAAMKSWPLGDHRLDWSRIDAVVIEPSRGRASFFIDALHLAATDGSRSQIWTARWSDPFVGGERGSGANPLPPPGGLYFPGLWNGRLGDTAQQLLRLLGGVGTSSRLPLESTGIRAAGLRVIHYSPWAEGYEKLVTQQGGWDVNLSGRSSNDVPFGVDALNGVHGLALAHPVVAEIARRRIDALVAAGIGVWMLVDYVFPWSDGPYGYAPDMVAAYRRDLMRTDEGLFVRVRTESRRVDFATYFNDYCGFFPQPEQMGLRGWHEYVPPRTGVPGHGQAWVLFLYLRSYEWLKAVDKAGRYFQGRGGDGIWVVPNPEAPWASSDYVYLLRSAGVMNLFGEWFGRIADSCEALYASGGWLRAEADRRGGRISIMTESGVMGHGPPYWDWRIAFGGIYSLASAIGADDLDADFLDETPFDQMSKPEHGPPFDRFRDAVAKAKAFRLARQDGFRRPRARILAIADRPPARAEAGSIFYHLDQPHSLARALSRAHLRFDLRDSLDLARVLDEYDVVVYAPTAPRVGDLALLRRWLEAKAGRTLVTHSFVPTRAMDEGWGADKGARLGARPQGGLLGLGQISQGEAAEITVDVAATEWASAFPRGKRIVVPSPLVRATEGEVLVGGREGTLVTGARVGRSRVVYLHFPPATAGADELARRAVSVVASSMGMRPFVVADPDTAVQLYEAGGVAAVSVWDRPTMAKWPFRYEQGVPRLELRASGLHRRVELPVTRRGRWIVYDFFGDEQRAVTPGARGVTLDLLDRCASLSYVGPETPATRRVIDRARRVRAWLRDLGFDRAP